MDGDIPANGQYKKLEKDQNRAFLYYICATQFGWDKETVDKQPIQYLMELMKTHIEVNKKNPASSMKSSLPRGMRKNF